MMLTEWLYSYGDSLGSELIIKIKPHQNNKACFFLNINIHVYVFSLGRKKLKIINKNKSVKSKSAGYYFD
jgi:hypothetical protein